MKLSPSAIYQKNFDKALFGYNTKAVDDFLIQLAKDWEEVLLECSALRETLKEKERQLLLYQEREKELQNAIHQASQLSERVREDAQRQAQVILLEAQQRADSLVRDARESLRKIYSEISDLKKRRIQFESNMRAILQAHLNLLEEGSQMLPGFELDTSQVELNRPNS